MEKTLRREGQHSTSSTTGRAQKAHPSELPYSSALSGTELRHGSVCLSGGHKGWADGKARSWALRLALDVANCNHSLTLGAFRHFSCVAEGSNWSTDAPINNR